MTSIVPAIIVRCCDVAGQGQAWFDDGAAFSLVAVQRMLDGYGTGGHEKRQHGPRVK